jgi:hypothetical protein
MDVNLDLNVSMGLADSDADADGVTDNELVVPLTYTPYFPPLATIFRQARSDLCSSSQYQSMRRPTLIPMQARAWTTLLRARIEAWTST